MIDKHSGLVKVKRVMDRESHYVTDGNYRVLVLAYDDGKPRILLLQVVSSVVNLKPRDFIPQTLSLPQGRALWSSVS